jgi:hypothetical protein
MVKPNTPIKGLADRVYATWIGAPLIVYPPPTKTYDRKTKRTKELRIKHDQ